MGVKMCHPKNNFGPLMTLPTIVERVTSSHEAAQVKAALERNTKIDEEA